MLGKVNNNITLLEEIDSGITLLNVLIILGTYDFITADDIAYVSLSSWTK